MTSRVDGFYPRASYTSFRCFVAPVRFVVRAYGLRWRIPLLLSDLGFTFLGL